MSTTTYHSVHLAVRQGIDLAYAEAGDRTAPTLILLHGFPTSSNQYRHLIPCLSDKYHVLAPDLPGFGSTVVHGDSSNLTFSDLADALEGFVDALGVKTFAVYIFDYGAPTALRFALRRPGAITALISQNGNAYTEGLGDFWAPVKALWATERGTPAFDAALAPLAGVLTLEATKAQYTGHGTPADRLDRIDPATYTLDYYQNLAGHADTQVSLFYDYRNNVGLYPQFQAWLRDSRVPVLAVWGAGDEIFVPAGAEAFKRDAADAEVHLLDGGHFLLETHVDEVAALIRAFLERIKFGAA
ncbi:putative hydrolase [Vanrija pseudolonga]|uniref:Purtative hydrolase n=1 Tax=Vanrija pseudolonga TaxID=143232 RepID=A0AAF0YIE3_9TREE|nr:purtative hydrolase [Vanrija pseudolonga]